MTATDIDLDALIDALAARAAARARPLVNAAGDEITGRAAAGLVTVNPGDLITSQWGNLTYGQSNLTFASVADRNNQWPTPPEGAQCVTLDTNSSWIYRAAAWHGRPAGYVASATGPTTAVNVGSAAVAVATITFPVVAGRRYRVNGFSNGAQATSVGNPRVLFGYTTAGGAAITADPAGSAVYLTVVNGAAIAVATVGSAVQLVTCTTSGTLTANINASTSAGTFNFGVNSCSIFAEDIGST